MILLFSCSLSFVGCISKEDNQVVIYCALDREFSQPILEDLSAELKIPIKKKFDLESNKTVGLTNEIIQNQNRPRADLFWNNEILQTINLENRGLLEPYRSPEATRFPDSFRSSNNAWYGFAGRYRVLIVNTDLMPNRSQWPSSMMDLVEEKYKKKCTLARPLFGTSATHAAVMFERLGAGPAEAFYRQLAANCVVLGGNKQVAQRVAEGKFLFGVTDTDDAIIEIEKGRPVAIVFPDQSDHQMGALLIPNTLCLIRNGPNPIAARRLMDRLLRSDIETRLALGRSAQIPLAKDVVQTSRALNTDSAIKTNPAKLKIMDVDFESAAQHWPENVLTLTKLFPVGGQ